MVIGAFPFGSGFTPPSPRRAVGFPLQSLTWVKGASPFGFIFRNTGCFLHSVRSRPLRQAAWWGAGAEAERTNGTHSPVPLPGASAVRRNFPCAVPFKRVPCCLSGSRLTVLSFSNRCHFLSGICHDCTDHIPCLRNLPPVFRHFPRTAIRKPDSLTAPSVYRKADGKHLANPHGTLPSKEPSFPPAMTNPSFFSLSGNRSSRLSVLPFLFSTGQVTCHSFNLLEGDFFPKLIGKTLTKVGGGESKSAKNAKSPPCG